MDNIFVIADLHLDHSNILKYEPIRLQKLLEWLKSNCSSMLQNEQDILNTFLDKTNPMHEVYMSLHNDMIIEAWNSVVKSNDIVFFLGDLAMTSNKEKLKVFIGKLNGRKRMIMGNHDTCRPSFYIECGFEQVSKLPVLFNNHLLLSHEPLDHDLVPECCINLFGHVHSNTEFNWERGICISAEQLKDFKPLKINNLIINNESLKDKWLNRHCKNQLSLELTFDDN